MRPNLTFHGYVQLEAANKHMAKEMTPLRTQPATFASSSLYQLLNRRYLKQNDNDEHDDDHDNDIDNNTTATNNI